jgi:hypothetical protein
MKEKKKSVKGIGVFWNIRGIFWKLIQLSVKIWIPMKTSWAKTLSWEVFEGLKV